MNRIFLCVTTCLLLPMGAFAQIATTTSLVGTVTDPTGQSIVGAKVIAVNAGTQDTYNATTNEQGSYRIEFVRVGTYNITIEQSGFRRFTKTGITVDINSVVRNDAMLTVGFGERVRHHRGIGASD